MVLRVSFLRILRMQKIVLPALPNKEDQIDENEKKEASNQDDIAEEKIRYRGGLESEHWVPTVR
jgi:hypothetical protein